MGGCEYKLTGERMVGIKDALQSDLIFKYWHPIGFLHEIPLSGDWVRFQLAGLDLIVFNDDGKIIAFENKCPHRGARFFDDQYGSGRIKCRYHGWGYRNGRMIFPPSTRFSPDQCPTPSINQFQVDFLGDMIFFAVEPQHELRTQLGVDVYDRLFNISRSVIERCDFNRYDFSASWPIAVENALEPYHIPFVHEETLDRLKLDEGHNFYFGKNSLWQSSVRNERALKVLKLLRMHLEHDFEYLGYSSIFIFPFTMISATYGLSYSIQNFFPSESIDDNRCRFTSRLYKVKLREGLSRQMYETFLRSTVEVNRKVFLEDEGVSSLVDSSCWSPFHKELYHMDNEEKVIHFRKSCTEVLNHFY